MHMLHLESSRLRRSLSDSRDGDLCVRVGGDSGEFLPQLDVSRWDDVGLSLRLLHDEPGRVSVDQQAIVWTAPSLEARFYALDLVGGGDELAVIWFQRPRSNVVRFATATAQAEVSYQRELAHVLSDGSSWETSPYGSRWERPAFAADSWVIYGRGCWGGFQRCGGYNYRAGRAFHIHRAWARDAAGHQVWCQTRWVDGVLSIEVPWAFLQSAVYPVMVDPTIGYSTQGASTDESLNTSVATTFTSPAAGDASPGTIHAYVKSGDGSAHNWKMGVYATSGGSPASQALLSTVVTISTTTSASFSDQSGAITWASISNATVYGLTRNGDHAQGKIAYDAGAPIYYYNPVELGGWALEATFGASPTFLADIKHSMWVDYSAVASDSGLKRRSTRPAPFKPMGPAFRPGAFRDWK